MRWLTVVACALSLAACAGGSVDGSAAPEASVAPKADRPTVDRVVRDPAISEASGLAVSGRDPARLLMHNDSGDAAVVFAVGKNGRTVATYRFDGVTARDWEGMARVGTGNQSTLYLGDIGDNRSTWRNIAVYIAPQPPGDGRLSVTATRYRLQFPDGPRDAEALLVSPTTGRIYVVSKRLTGAAIYLAPNDLRSTGFNQLTRWRSAPAFVTDGAFAPDGSRYALRTYTSAFIYDASSGAQQARIELPAQPQGESLTWTADGAALLVGSEGQRQRIWRVPVPPE